MRGIRVGAQPSVVGVHVRAAIASWKTGAGVLGGVALLGCQPRGCPEPVDAVILLPRAILIVVGVDLPEPAMRLDAPLEDTWRVDGWPLVRPDGPLNPATQVLGTAEAVSGVLRRAHPEMLNIHTVVAVGPYAAEVQQPSTRAGASRVTNTVVLHPEANTLLAAAKVAQGNAEPFPVDDARKLIETLAPEAPTPRTAELAAEGFPDVVSPELAAELTSLLPRQVRSPPQMPPPLQRKPKPDPPPAQPQTGHRPGELSGRLRWLPVAAVTMLCLLVATGIGMALVSGPEQSPRDTPQNSAQQTDRGPSDETAVRRASVAVDGVRFTTMATSTGQQCSGYAFGAVRSWLAASNCGEIVRSVFQTSENGDAAAVSVAKLAFGDAASARRFADKARKPGSGGITDLVAEGRGWDGGPETFDGAAFAVSAQGKQARLTTAVWAQRPSKPTDQKLRQLADRALRLPM